MPISFAKEVAIPELFQIAPKASNIQEGKEVYFYTGGSLIASLKESSLKYQYSRKLGSDFESKTLPFGQPILTNNRFSFTGKELDEELYYFSARYYDPNLGRFTTVDPVPTEPSYVYVYNSPLNKVDPDGRLATTGTLVDPWLTALEQLMQEVSRGTTYAEAASGGSVFLAGAGAVLAGFFLTSANMQANIQGRSDAMYDPFGLLDEINPMNIRPKGPEDDFDVDEFLQQNDNFVRPNRKPMEKFEHMDGRIEYSALTEKDIKDGKFATFSIGIKRLQATGAALGEITSKGHTTSTYEFKINRPDSIRQYEADILISDLMGRLQYQFGLSNKEAFRVAGEIRFYVNSFKGSGMPNLLHQQIMSPVDITSKGGYKESGHQVGIYITNQNIPSEMPNYAM